MPVFSHLILVLSCFFLVSGKDYCRQKCPCKDLMHPTVLLPGPSVKQFYMCVFGKATLFNCPPGTNFNPRIKVCDWPHSAGSVVCSRSPNCDDSDSGSFEGSGSDEN